jgi:hypothetical protein
VGLLVEAVRPARGGGWGGGGGGGASEKLTSRPAKLVRQKFRISGFHPPTCCQRIWPGYFRGGAILNVRFRGRNCRSSDGHHRSSDTYCTTGTRLEHDIRGDYGKVLDAAYSDVPVGQSVLPRTATNGPFRVPDKGIRKPPAFRRRIACRLSHNQVLSILSWVGLKG